MIPQDQYADANEEVERLRDLILQFSDAMKANKELKIACPLSTAVTDFYAELHADTLSKHTIGCAHCLKIVSAIKELCDEV